LKLIFDLESYFPIFNASYYFFVVGVAYIFRITGPPSSFKVIRLISRSRRFKVKRILMTIIMVSMTTHVGYSEKVEFKHADNGLLHRGPVRHVVSQPVTGVASTAYEC